MAKFTVPNEGKLFLADNIEEGIPSASNYWLLRLYKSLTGTLGNATVVSSFTECDFSGYVSEDVTSQAPRLDGNEAKMLFTMRNPPFAHNGGATSNTVLGWYLTDNGNNTVIAARAFPTSKTMNDASDTINFEIDLCFDMKPTT